MASAFKSSQEFDNIVLSSSMSTKKIKRLMSEYSGVRFGVGVYDLKEPLVLRSNQTVICDEGVIFRRKHRGRMLVSDFGPDTVKYKGTKNASWLGGHFIANTNAKAANVITLFHASNITLEDVVVEGCINYHSLELNACKSIVVNGCKFLKQTYEGTDDFREAIQIDFANYDGLKVIDATNESKCYDGTHCKDITINECSFEDVPNGIGTHTVGPDEKYHTDINISFCTFKNIHDRAIKVAGMRSVCISEIIGSSADVYFNSFEKAHLINGGTVALQNKRYSKDVVVRVYDKNKKKCINVKYT